MLKSRLWKNNMKCTRLLAIIFIPSCATGEEVSIEQKAVCAKYAGNASKLGELTSNMFRAAQVGVLAKMANTLPPEAAAAARKADVAEQIAIPAGKDYASAIDDLAYQLRKCAR